jgi:hypothetical protein
MPRRISGSRVRRSIATKNAHRMALAPQATDASRRPSGCSSRAMPIAAERSRATDVRDEPQREQQDRCRDERRREEYPPPADRGEDAPGEETQRVACGGGAGIDQYRLVARRAFWEIRRHEREARGRHEGGRETGDEAGGEQHPSFAGEPAEPGQDREHAERGEKDTAPPVEITDAPAQQHEAGIADHIGADDGAKRRGPKAEIGADLRQRDIQHRDVEALQEDGAAQNKKNALLPQAHADRRGGGRMREG